MPLFLEIVKGPTPGSKYFIDTGQILTLGRSQPADLSFPADSFLSALHFSIECRPERCVIRDLKSTNGTFLDGKRIEEATLFPGSRIKAGSLELVPIFLSDSLSAPSQPLQAAEEAPQFLSYFSCLQSPLYCLMDAACDQRILGLINASEERFQCLYEGDSAKELQAHAPYLVRLPYGSKFLKILLSEGLGKGWATYFVSQSSFENLRHHFRRFLLVKLDSGDEAYFRFYDPRVLRDFLPTCNTAELEEFFGPVEVWIAESKTHGALHTFAHQHGRLDISAVYMAH